MKKKKIVARIVTEAYFTKEKFQKMERALIQLQGCDLNEDNCADFDVANRRIRNLANLALS